MTASSTCPEMSIYARTIQIVKRNGIFICDVATVMSGAGLSQVLSIAFAPIVSRLYLPEHYGLLALLLSLHAIVTQWCCLSYNQAIVLPKEDEEAMRLVALAGACLTALCMLIMLVISMVPLFSIGLGRYAQLGAWLYMVPLIIFITGLNNTMIGWNTRKRHYKTTSFAQIAAVTATNGTKIAAGAAFGSTISWLIAGTVIGFFGELLVLLRRIKSFLWQRIPQWKWSELLGCAKKYRDFPLYNAPANAIVSVTANLPILTLGYFFDPAIVGFYAMAQRIVALPVSLLSLSTRQVFEQRLAQLKNQKKPLQGPFIKTTLGLLLISSIPVLVVAFAGEFLFSILLGGNWATAGKYAVILTPWLATSIMIQPSNSVFVVLRQQRKLLFYQIIAFFMMGLAFALAIALPCTPEGFLWAFVLVRSLVNILIMVRAYHYAGSYQPN